MGYRAVPTTFFDNGVTNLRDVSLIDNNFSYVSGKVLSVKDFGAVGDGVTDDTQAIQDAIAYVNAALTIPIRLVFQPGGNYKITGTGLNTINRGNIAVEGFGATLILGAGTNGLAFNAVSPLTNIAINGLQITSLGTGGIGLQVLNSQMVTINQVTISNVVTGLYVGTYEYVRTNLLNIDICTTAIQLVSGDGFFLANSRLNGTNAANAVAGSKGIKVVAGSGTLISNTDITRFEKGVSLEPTLGLGVTWFFMSNVECDTCGYGLYGDVGAGLALWGLEIVNCWFSAGTQNGVFLSNAIGVSISNSIIFLNKSWGLFVTACKEVNIRSSFITKNNQNGTAGVGGMYEESSTSVNIVDNTFDNDNVNMWNNVSWTQTQHVGFQHAVGGNDINIINNDFIGQDTADITFSVTPARGYVRGNSTDRSNIVASAANITPELVHDVVHISGVTNVTNILSPQIPNREVKFITDGICTIQNGNNWKLAGAANFAGTAGSILSTLVNPTTGLVTETARSIL